MAVDDLPRVQLRRTDDLPFFDTGDGVDLQLLQVDLAEGLWVVRSRFRPGTTIQRHRHTGTVMAVTLAGRWVYLEYPDVVNEAGSYLFEPAGSVHTLHVPDDQEGGADVWFAIRGANLQLRDDDTVEYAVDAHLVYDVYRGMCDAAGIDCATIVT